jgi:hypothetical protein
MEAFPENDDIVMKEIERRGPMPFDPGILAALGNGVTFSDCRPGEVLYGQGDTVKAVF